jgi:hypothetical protein
VDFSAEILQDRKVWFVILKVMGGGERETTNQEFPEKLSLKNEEGPDLVIACTYNPSYSEAEIRRIEV